MVTIKELAEQLGVSISTVSKALNNSAEIGEATTNRVKELARLQNYQPNKSAVSLKSNKTKTIGVIIPNILNQFFANSLLGIEEQASQKGYNIITCISNEMFEKEENSLHLLANGSVDGFILAIAKESQLSESFEHFTAIQKKGLPIVMFDRVTNKVHCDKIIIDDFQAAEEATTLLFSKRCSTVGFISTIGDLNVGKLRGEGYKNAIKSRYGDDSKAIILNIRNVENIQKELTLFLKENPNIDGILAADNVSGTVAINICKELGYRIPEELSIIGFADQITSLLSTPKLTYVNQHARDMGKNAVDLLVDRLNSKKNAAFETKVMSTTISFSQSA